MKKIIFGVLSGSVFLLAGCKQLSPAAAGGTGSMSALSAAVSPVAPYQCVQTKGNVRVVLLKVERGTLFTARNVADAKSDKTYPVPSFDVAYQVEALGDEPINKWNVQDEEITMGTRRIADGQFLPVNVVAGGSGETRPAGHRSMIQENHIVAGEVQAGKMTLTLKTGFNEHNETFVFANVPLN
jgi:hypothetical protein